MDKASGSSSSWEYMDFELEVREGGQGEYSVSVLRSPAGEPQERMRLPFETKPKLEERLGALEDALYRSSETRSTRTRRHINSPEEWALQIFGRGLFEALLSGEVHACYRMSLREARQQRKGLRLKLRIQPPELAQLPWEFLYDPARDEYLCLSARRPLVRYLNLPQPVEQLRVEPPLRILGMVASPSDLPELDVQDEKRRVEQAVKELREDGLVELTWLEGETCEDLEQAMWGGPWHIFHFVGHGAFNPFSEEGAIALADEGGCKHLLAAKNLATLLTDHDDLRLVFLNSCEGARSGEGDAFSGAAATLVRRGIPAVLAMQYEITDEAAIAFSRAFYRAVAGGLPVDAAVASGRTSLSRKLDDTLEWGTPVLYMRSSDGRIFEIPTSTPLVEPPEVETESLEEEGPHRRYREYVEAAWADGELTASEVEALEERANGLGLSPGVAAEIEREVMGGTKETMLERQSRAREESVVDGDLRETSNDGHMVIEDSPETLGPDGEQRVSKGQDTEDDVRKLAADLGPAGQGGRQEATSGGRKVADDGGAGSQDRRRQEGLGDGTSSSTTVRGGGAGSQEDRRGGALPLILGAAGLVAVMVLAFVLFRAAVAPDSSSLAQVPSLYEQTLVEARQAAGDFEVVVRGGSVTGEIVLTQDPQPGERAAASSTIYVTLGTCDGLCAEVPNIKERSVSDAIDALESEGLNPGNQDEAPSATLDEGRIISQTPPAGSRLPQDTPVSFTVSTGP